MAESKVALWVMAGVAVTVLICVAYSGACFGFSYVEMDTVSYLFQAKLFAMGRLFAAAPPSFAFSPSPHINIVNGLWYSKYPPGNALVLALGVLLGVPWLIPALATGGAVYLLYKIIREIYDLRTALAGLAFAVLSPATFVMGASWFSEAVSRLFIGLFLFSLLRAFRSGRLLWAIPGGLALGFAFSTRPLAAVSIGFAAVLACGLHAASRQDWKALVRVLACLSGAVLLTGSLTLLWNYEATGNPLRNTFNVQQTLDRIGFGQRANGYNPGPRDRVDYTPRAAARRTILRTIPAVLQNALGIGYYAPGMYQRLTRGPWAVRLLTGFGVALLLIPLGLALLPLSKRNEFPAARLFALIVGGSLIGYALYFFEGTATGFTPANSRYHTEAIMFGLLPLIARGSVLAWNTWAAKIRAANRAWVLLAAILLAGNYAYNNYRYFDWLANRAALLRVAGESIESIQSSHAVVFFYPGFYNPLGEYPFQKMQEARIVTFRLACDPVWGLQERDFGAAYRRYFQGRDAFLLGPNLELQSLNDAALRAGSPECSADIDDAPRPR